MSFIHANCTVREGTDRNVACGEGEPLNFSSHGGEVNSSIYNLKNVAKIKYKIINKAIFMDKFYVKSRTVTLLKDILYRNVYFKCI